MFEIRGAKRSAWPSKRLGRDCLWSLPGLNGRRGEKERERERIGKTI